MVNHPELATELLDPEPYPPLPEAQERIWPAVENSIKALKVALSGSPG
jgi:hypothetical protein